MKGHDAPINHKYIHTMITHVLSVYAKKTGRLILRGEFEWESDAFRAASAILRANPSRYTCVVGTA